MNRLMFIDTGKTRPSLTTRPAQRPVRGTWLRYSTVIATHSTILYVLLPSLPFHRLLGRPGLAKLTPGSTAP